MDGPYSVGPTVLCLLIVLRTCTGESITLREWLSTGAGEVETHRTLSCTVSIRVTRVWQTRIWNCENGSYQYNSYKWHVNDSVSRLNDGYKDLKQWNWIIYTWHTYSVSIMMVIHNEVYNTSLYRLTLSFCHVTWQKINNSVRRWALIKM